MYVDKLGNLVPGIGPDKCKIVIVGEAPGEQEDRQLLPFVGSAGTVLDTLLVKAGLSRPDIYITNIIKRRPPGNNFGVFYEDKSRNKPTPYLTKARMELIDEVKERDPNIVILLGNEAAKTFLGSVSISDVRGSIYERYGLKIIPTYHPAYLMRQWGDFPITLFDFKRAKENSDYKEVRCRPRKLITMPTYAEVIRYLDKIYNVAEYLAYDIETETNQITCIGLSYKPDEAICIPFWFGSSMSYYTLDEEYHIWQMIEKILNKPDIKSIAQNCVYDNYYLKMIYGIEVTNLWMDTMIAHHATYPEFPKSLGFQVSLYTDHPYYKSEIKTDNAIQYFEYNAKDACLTLECAMKLKDEMKDWGVDNFYFNTCHKYIEPLFAMSCTGVRIDKQALKELKVEFEEITQQKEDELNAECFNQEEYKLRQTDLTISLETYEAEYKQLMEQKVNKESRAEGIMEKRAEIRKKLAETKKTLKELPEQYTLNVNSPTQMQRWLYEIKKFPIMKSYKKGRGDAIATDEEILKAIYAKTGDEALKRVIELRKLKKFINTYINMDIDKDGRIRCAYNIAGTVTGRLSSSANPLGTGLNLQNIPKRGLGKIFRRVFIPDEGKVFIHADFSQAEARIVAALAKESNLLQIFEEGGDIHTKNAALIYNIPEGSVSSEQRQNAKVAVHGGNYAMSYLRLAKEYGMTNKEAKDILEAYFKAFPRIKTWHKQIESTLHKTKMLVTPMGRKRQFNNRIDKETIKEAYAYIPQSTVGDLMNMSIVDIYKEVKDVKDIDCLLNIHDAIVMQARPDQVDYVVEVLKRAMLRELYIDGLFITIPIDIEVGNNWYDLISLKEWKEAYNEQRQYNMQA